VRRVIRAIPSEKRGAVIVEHAEFTITPGREAEFEEAFVRGHRFIAQSPGYLWGRLVRQVEQPNRYLLLVGWESVEAHTVEFRGSALFTQWRGEVGAFFAEPAVVTHYSGDLEAADLK
jgi:heme-degrading monooxygenase HmoA